MNREKAADVTDAETSQNVSILALYGVVNAERMKCVTLQRLTVSFGYSRLNTHSQRARPSWHSNHGTSTVQPVATSEMNESNTANGTGRARAQKITLIL